MQLQEESEEVQLLSHLTPRTTWLAGSRETLTMQKTWCRKPTCVPISAFQTFRGGNGRAWLLSIVRNCSYDLLQAQRCADL